MSLRFLFGYSFSFDFITLESIFSSLKALVIGIPLGIFGSFLVTRAVRELTQEENRLMIPWIWTLGAIVGVFVITWLTMLYTGNRLKDRNIIERIRSGSGM